MQLHRFDNVQKFWQNAQDYLLQHEAEHNALLGVMHTLLHYPERCSDPYLAICISGDAGALIHTDSILAIAIRTPPNILLLSKAQNLAALKVIAQDLQHEQLPGVSGLVTEVEAFGQAWQTLTGQIRQQELEMRIHQLTQVNPVMAVSGHLRLATEADRPLLLQWFAAFDSEIGLPTGNAEERVDLRLKQQSLYLWEDGAPVSLVGGKAFSATAGRIAPVYTPPAQRRQGYATASVAALSQRLLDQGCTRCFLFTDVTNPTSNHIYQQIGYHPICDYREYSFIASE